MRRGGGANLGKGDVLFRGGHSIEDGRGHGGGSKNKEKVATSFMDGPL